MKNSESKQAYNKPYKFSLQINLQAVNQHIQQVPPAREIQTQTRHSREIQVTATLSRIQVQEIQVTATLSSLQVNNAREVYTTFTRFQDQEIQVTATLSSLQVNNAREVYTTFTELSLYNYTRSLKKYKSTIQEIQVNYNVQKDLCQVNYACGMYTASIERSRYCCTHTSSGQRRIRTRSLLVYYELESEE
ncbi:hypothetical protein RND81_08G126100 [Saponaria officinalis]|uniref:Uncharacterized protein n=1 Tax=Saponaria officinalis TaxID=3572 RepID=A0AAW1J6R1_SAPOF